MKKSIFILLCLLSVSTVISQTEISGTVKDNAGVPITGANVSILDSNSGATTDFDGNFNFSTSIEGTRQLQVSFVGY
ncbi:MAG: carboxypeptidase-like regulatory domain-containing protein, partial [Bacteroidia bacterium]|nr:carboxypeptidase-like regulatory domain-containing protein [Bacteroidia bacterium]